MFAKTIIDSDAFLEMPATTQMLYFHLAMRADDEGFVNNPKRIQRMVGAADDDLKVLIAKKFIIAFESGVIVIKHWKIHNYIRGDRIHQTKYKNEKALLKEDENNSYTLCQSNVSQMSVSCHTEVRLGKDRIGKDNTKEKVLEKESPQKTDTTTRSTFSKSVGYGPNKNVFLTEAEYTELEKELHGDLDRIIRRMSEGIATRGYKILNFPAKIRQWAEEDKAKGYTTQKPSARGNFQQREYDDEFYDKLLEEKMNT